LRLNENRKGLISIIETIQYEDLLFRTEVWVLGKSERQSAPDTN
jgi:hypothetical protein